MSAALSSEARAPTNNRRERPILFSAPMVRALLAGAKTQTRRIVRTSTGSSAAGRTDIRIVRVAHGEHRGSFCYLDFDGVPGISWRPFGGAPTEPYPHPERCCPHGLPGERLWVKETFAWSVKDPDSHAELGDPENYDPIYRADAENVGEWERYEDGKSVGKTTPTWRSPLFMPRWASRITLEITDVRVQRVQEISEEDARAEGVTLGELQPALINGKPGKLAVYDARTAFALLWDQINGKRHLRVIDADGEPHGDRKPMTWASNPFVWAITFKRAEG